MSASIGTGYDVEAAELRRQIAERKAQIAERDARIAERDVEILEGERRIAQIWEQNAALGNAIAELQETSAAFQAETENLRDRDLLLLKRRQRERTRMENRVSAVAMCIFLISLLIAIGVTCGVIRLT